MLRPALEIADIFRDHGAAWRKANAGHVSLEQLKVMSAIESCRTAALGGHVALCEKCAHIHVAYNSCLMGKFRNGELMTGFIELNVNFGDFALHYRLRPSDLLSEPRPFVQTPLTLTGIDPGVLTGIDPPTRSESASLIGPVWRAPSS